MHGLFIFLIIVSLIFILLLFALYIYQQRRQITDDERRYNALCNWLENHQIDTREIIRQLGLSIGHHEYVYTMLKEKTMPETYFNRLIELGVPEKLLLFVLKPEWPNASATIENQNTNM